MQMKIWRQQTVVEGEQEKENPFSGSSFAVPVR